MEMFPYWYVFLKKVGKKTFKKMDVGIIVSYGDVPLLVGVGALTYFLSPDFL